MSSDSVAQDQIKAFVDRILRLKEEVKAINADIREIYGEAKGNGFDKTILGKLVNYVEKRQSDSAAQAEGEALFDLYLSAYDGISFDDDGVPSRTYAHEEPDHDAETGEIIEPQSAPQAAQTGTDSLESSASIGSRVGTSPVESEAVAISTPIQPETANDIRVQDAKVLTPKAVATVEAEPAQGAQILRPGPDYAELGVVVMESCPPEGIVAHPFAACWPVNNIDATGGINHPIVKMGKFILDGRGRYFAARAAGIEYPVVQYDGADPLTDSIRWNIVSRTMSGMPLRIVAQKLCKLEPSRSDEIMDLMGLAEIHEAAE